MSDIEKQPSDKRHIPPDVFQAAQGSRILVFCVVQAKSPAHKKEKKKIQGFSDQNSDLHQVACH